MFQILSFFAFFPEFHSKLIKTVNFLSKSTFCVSIFCFIFEIQSFCNSRVICSNIVWLSLILRFVIWNKIRPDNFDEILFQPNFQIELGALFTFLKVSMEYLRYRIYSDNLVFPSDLVVENKTAKTQEKSQKHIGQIIHFFVSWDSIIWR